jgi:hypothetical protein
MADIRTEHGLIIKKVDLDQGGFHVDLVKPEEHDPKGKVFVRVTYDVVRRTWQYRRSMLRPGSLLDVINGADGRYAIERKPIDQAERQQQEERDRLNAIVAEAWEEVVEHFDADTGADD